MAQLQILLENFHCNKTKRRPQKILIRIPHPRHRIRKKVYHYSFRRRTETKFRKIERIILRYFHRHIGRQARKKRHRFKIKRPKLAHLHYRLQKKTTRKNLGIHFTKIDH